MRIRGFVTLAVLCAAVFLIAAGSLVWGPGSGTTIIIRPTTGNMAIAWEINGDAAQAADSGTMLLGSFAFGEVSSITADVVINNVTYYGVNASKVAMMLNENGTNKLFRVQTVDGDAEWTLGGTAFTSTSTSAPGWNDRLVNATAASGASLTATIQVLMPGGQVQTVDVTATKATITF